MTFLGALVGVGMLMYVMFGDVFQFIPIAFIILVGLKATQAVNRRR